MSDSTVMIRACYGPAAQGGLANVWVADAEQGPDPARLARESRATTVIVTKKNNGYQVDSYSPKGTPIRFCGHGALAAGWLALTDLEPEAPELEFSSTTRAWRARRGGLHGCDVTLIFAAPALAEIDVPGFAPSCIGKQSVAAAESGAADDYLILELADAAAVSAVQADGDAISRHTQRALIVTAASDDGVGCVFRYFAPQYGEPESMVTGSAAVQLAAWWAPRLGKQKFSGRQLSADGALMHLGCHDGVVELAAQVGYG